MVEREPQPRAVVVDVLSAIDSKASIDEQLPRALRVLAMANTALKAMKLDIELMPMGRDGREAGQVLNTETLGVDEASALVTEARHDELERVLASIQDFYKANSLDSERVMSLLLTYLANRHVAVDRLAQRDPDNNPTTEGGDE